MRLSIGIIFSAFIMLMSVSLINAQGRDQMKEELKELKEKLSLMPEQETKIQEIFSKYQELAQKERAAIGDNRMDMMKMRRQNSNKMYEEIELILDENQKMIFDEYKKDREEKMKERMNNFRDNRGDRMGGGRRSQ